MPTDKPDFTSMTAEERIKLAERIYVVYPRIRAILSKIKHCHQHSMTSAEPECMLIKGDTGAGKTTLYRHYEQDYPRVETKELTTIPVLSSTIPVPATPKSLATKLLTKMGDPLAASGTLVTQTLRLQCLLKRCGVELIILDEFQHFIDRDSNRVLQTISDWLKELLNESRIPIVLIGMPNCDLILERNSQLRRRFGVRESLEPFKWEHPDPEVQRQVRTEFRRFLKTLDEQFPLIERSNLADPATAYLIYSATKGSVASVVKLLRRAVSLTILNGEEKVTLETLADAYDQCLAAERPEAKNPFVL